MDLEVVRAQLEEDLSWRAAELRALRNELLGDIPEAGDWPAAALRALMVMQYAHLEGFTQHALGLYVEAVNDMALAAGELQTRLFAAALAREFKVLTAGAQVNEDESSLLLRRAKRQVALIEKLLIGAREPIVIPVEDAISLEMNLGADVLKRNLYLLGIPESSLGGATYGTLEFIRRNRHDIAHGGRRERIEPRLFEAHWRRAEEYMSELIRLLSRALREGWYRRPPMSPATS